MPFLSSKIARRYDPSENQLSRPQTYLTTFEEEYVTVLISHLTGALQKYC